MRYYFPIRDSERFVCKKVLLKEEILPHQNFQFFQTYANSNKTAGSLHVRITVIYYINLKHRLETSFFRSLIFV